MTKLSRAFVLAVIFYSTVTILIVWYLDCTGRISLFGPRAPRFLGSPKTPAISFIALGYSKPFSAKVVSKKIGTWGPLVDSSTGKLLPGARPRDYVIVDLLKSNGKELALYEENPRADIIAFVSNLVEGREYSFPGALTNWAAKKAVEERQKGDVR